MTGAHDDSRSLPSCDVVSTWLPEVAQRGYSRVRTSAVAPSMQRVLQDAGFEVCQELSLLRAKSPLQIAPARVSDLQLRTMRHFGGRLKESARTKILSTDAAAFGPLWALDATSLRDALLATQRARLFSVGTDTCEGSLSWLTRGRLGLYNV